MPRLPERPHAAEVEPLLDALGASGQDGLTGADAAERLAHFGPNRLPEPEREPAWKRLARQFADPIVLTLIVAAVVAAFVGMTESGATTFFGRYADAIAISAVVLLNGFLGYYQEERAETALKALYELAAPRARVRRDGEVVELAADELVPGDLLVLESGDAIPADARLVQTVGLSTEESALTGESVPVGKDALAHIADDAPLGDRATMVHTGTMVVRGRARAVVVGTGVDTELGRIGAMMASIDAENTPLQERLEKFGKIILWVCIALSVALMAWGYVRPSVIGGAPRPWHGLLLEAVALAVAAIPEGLPAITTITLALGMQRMAARGAIVRRLPAVETLGSATVICTDKTGTLTQNAMTVREVHTLDRHYSVEGEGYAVEGRIVDADGGAIAEGSIPEPLEHLLATAALCNHATLTTDDDGKPSIMGDPTEGALLVLAAKLGFTHDGLLEEGEVLAELPFDSDRKRMTVVARDAQGRAIAHVKGGLDVLLSRCASIEGPDGVVPLDDATADAIRADAEAMSGKALRVLALCRRETDEDNDGDEVENELTFLGMVGMIDPPRTAVPDAVARCRAAGIRPVMITGDHKVTAQAIAEEIGMWSDGDEALTGSELAELSDEELDDHIKRVRVFARTTAAQKLRIVRAFKRAGEVVAMTGDGVNDAPALREASIGVAMGRSGTDVARQASDLVLADDNFATIVDAVREGRAIYRNIQKFIFFLLSANMGLVVAVFCVSLVEKWPPLTPLMVLWINLVTNGLPALALGVDPPSEGLMREPPRDPDEELMLMRDYLGIVFVGMIMGCAAIALYFRAPQHTQGLLEARALAFTLLALSPLLHSLSCRSPIESIAQMRPLVSRVLVVAMTISAAIHAIAVLWPTMRPVFRTYPMTNDDMLVVLGLSALIVPAVEIAKAIDRARIAARHAG